MGGLAVGRSRVLLATACFGQSAGPTSHFRWAYLEYLGVM